MSRLLLLAIVLTSSIVKAEPSIYSELNCLALNIYFESRNQSKLGKYGVAEVVLNRVKSEKYPNDICSVVYQAKTYMNAAGVVYPKRNMCQFSWYCDGKSDIPKDTKMWVEALKISVNILGQPATDITEGSLFYHSIAVNPYWAKSLTRVVRIDDHIFYKEKDWK